VLSVMMSASGFWLDRRLFVNSYDRTSAPPDDVGRQKGCKVRIARDPEVKLSKSSVRQADLNEAAVRAADAFACSWTDI
jgi:hypothetical protein